MNDKHYVSYYTKGRMDIYHALDKNMIHVNEEDGSLLKENVNYAAYAIRSDNSLTVCGT